MKKYISAALGLLILGASSVAVLAESKNKFPKEPGGLAHENLKFQGVKILRIDQTADAKSLVEGEGFLDWMCVIGGVTGAYSAAFDTNIAGGAQANLAVFDYYISPKVDTTISTGNLGGCWVPPDPVKFVTGLYGRQSDAGHTTLFAVHCSDGSNPCTIGE